MTNEQCHPILCQRQARILWGTNYSSGDLQGNSKLLNCYLLPLLLTASTLHNNGCILNFYGVFFLIGGTLQNCVQWPLYQITSKPCQLFKTKRSYSVGVVTHRNQFYNVNTHASSYTLANITKVDIKSSSCWMFHGLQLILFSVALVKLSCFSQNTSIARYLLKSSLLVNQQLEKKHIAAGSEISIKNCRQQLK